MRRLRFREDGYHHMVASIYDLTGGLGIYNTNNLLQQMENAGWLQQLTNGLTRYVLITPEGRRKFGSDSI